MLADFGWAVQGVDYNAWAASKTFYTGDVLSESFYQVCSDHHIYGCSLISLFNYVPGDHNVVVAANYDVYDKCGTSPNLGVWTSGNDVLTLPTKSTYYFLSEFHCDYTEQRIMVDW